MERQPWGVQQRQLRSSRLCGGGRVYNYSWLKKSKLCAHLCVYIYLYICIYKSVYVYITLCVYMYVYAYNV